MAVASVVKVIPCYGPSCDKQGDGGYSEEDVTQLECHRCKSDCNSPAIKQSKGATHQKSIRRIFGRVLILIKSAWNESYRALAIAEPGVDYDSRFQLTSVTTPPIGFPHRSTTYPRRIDFEPVLISNGHMRSPSTMRCRRSDHASSVESSGSTSAVVKEAPSHRYRKGTLLAAKLHSWSSVPSSRTYP